MSNWAQIRNLLDRTFSIYTAGQTIDASGGIVVSPVYKYQNIQGSIQPLTGNNKTSFGKQVIDADTCFICLQALAIQNGDIVLDDNSNKYSISYFEDVNVVTGRYVAVYGLRIIE